MRGAIMVLIALNIALAVGRSPGAAKSRGWIDCCREHVFGAYCCEGCCWFAWSCGTDDDCRDN